MTTQEVATQKQRHRGKAAVLLEMKSTAGERSEFVVLYFYWHHDGLTLFFTCSFIKTKKSVGIQERTKETNWTKLVSRRRPFTWVFQKQRDSPVYTNRERCCHWKHFSWQPSLSPRGPQCLQRVLHGPLLVINLDITSKGKIGKKWQVYDSPGNILLPGVYLNSLFVFCWLKGKVFTIAYAIWQGILFDSKEILCFENRQTLGTKSSLKLWL